MNTAMTFRDAMPGSAPRRRRRRTVRALRRLRRPRAADPHGLHARRGKCRARRFLSRLYRRTAPPDFPATLRRMQMGVPARTWAFAVGAATTKLVAAMASRLQRPRGFELLPPGTKKKFSRAAARGKATRHRPCPRYDAGRARRHWTIGEPRAPPRARRHLRRSRWPATLRPRARPRRPRSDTPAPPKSISRETTIEGGTIDAEFLGGD